MRRAVLLATLLVAGCGSAKVDVCSGIHGTCVDLTVVSSQKLTLDQLSFTASGAVNEMRSSQAGKTVSLPLHVGATLPAGISGALHLIVDGLSAGAEVATGAVDLVIVSGQRNSATIDIEPPGGGGDLAGLDLSGLDLAVADLAGVDLAGVDLSQSSGADGGSDMLVVTPPCDPKGLSGPACVWRWQNPLPQGDDFVGVYAFGDSDIYAVNPSGLVLHRNATGWSYATPPTAFPLSFFAEGLSGGGAGTTHDLYAFGENFTPPSTITQAIYHTTDEQTWTAETLCNNAACSTALPTGTALHAISATADNLYAMVAGDDSPSSTDGLVFIRSSTQWIRATAPATRAHLNGVAVGDNDAIAVGDNNPTSGSPAGLIWTAHNNSGNWAAFTTAALAPAQPLTAACTGSGTFITVGGGGTVAFTKTIGSGFANATTTGTSANLKGCVVLNANEAFAFGAGGVVIHTTDGGANWTTKSSTVSADLLAGSQSPAAALTLVGAGGVIVRTTDGFVSTVTEEDSGTRPNLTAMWGVSPGVAYAVGASGIILHTVDDGVHWTSLGTTGTTAALYAVWGSSATDVYAGGASGTIVHSTNGTTFTKVTSANLPATVTVNQISGASAADVYATTVDSSFNAKLVRSTDGGGTWNFETVTGLAATTQSLALLAMPGHLWVQSQNQAVFHGVIAGNGTISWNQQAVRFMGNAITDSLYSFTGNGSDFYAVTANSAFVHATMATSASGGTWDFETETPASIWGDGLSAVLLTPSGSTLYMTGSGGLLTSSTPGASVTWSRLSTGIAEVSPGGAMLALADNDVFVIANGGIIHYGN